MKFLKHPETPSFSETFLGRCMYLKNGNFAIYYLISTIFIPLEKEKICLLFLYDRKWLSYAHENIDFFFLFLPDISNFNDNLMDYFIL